MIQWPSLLGGTHKLVSWLNRLLRACRSAEIKQVVGGYLKPSTDGQCLVILGNNSGSSAGWNWADPIAYDKDSSYAKGEVVVITPTDAIVTAGAEDVEDGGVIRATAGIYTATRAVAPVNVGTEETPVWSYHVPQWPLFAPDTPDDPDVYWMLVSLYPNELTICSGGEEIVMYVNAQPKQIYA
jgi:hypothetical protein